MGIAQLSEEEYRPIARVRTVDEKPHVQKLSCSKAPTPQELNLLYVLCEHVSKTISIDDICHRMKLNSTAVRVLACRLRKKLSEDWTIQSVNNAGMRILYVGTELFDAQKTRLDIDFTAVARKREPHTLEARQKMTEAAIVNQAHLHFRFRRRRV